MLIDRVILWKLQYNYNFSLTYLIDKKKTQFLDGDIFCHDVCNIIAAQLRISNNYVTMVAMQQSHLPRQCR